MRIIPPIQVEDIGATDALAELITAESTIPEPDASDPEEASATIWSAGTYNLGDRVIEGHILYECVDDPTTATQPSVGVNLDPPAWVVVGPSNQWKCLTLNSSVESQSIFADSITYTFDVNIEIDKLAVHNISAQTVTVKFYDADDNLVYNETLSTASLVGVVDQFDWCFKRPKPTRKLADFDIPPYESGTLEVIIDNTGSQAGVGKIVFGYSEDMGRTLSPVRSSSIDLGSTSRNDYGSTILRVGRVIFRKDFDSIVSSERASELEDIVKDLSGEPCTIIGEPDDDYTIIYGRILDYQIVMNAYPLSQTTLNTEEF